MESEKHPSMATESPFSHDDLAKKFLEGDDEAFASLVENSSKRFYRLAYRILRDQHEAEDMIQTAFLKFWDQPKKWDPHRGAKWTTWFYQVVVHLCLDFLKKKRPDLSSIPLEKPNESSTSDLEGARDRAERIKVWLLELPPRQRAALSLCVYEELPQAEAAKILGVSLKALESLLSRAKGFLKHRAQEWEAQEA